MSLENPNVILGQLEIYNEIRHYSFDGICGRQVRFYSNPIDHYKEHPGWYDWCRGPDGMKREVISLRSPFDEPIPECAPCLARLASSLYSKTVKLTVKEII